MMKANLIKVKVYPKDLKSIPDILPYNKLIHGDPVEMELDKKEIQRCMNFADVFDLSSGEEVLIDELSYHEIVEFVEKTDSEEESTDSEISKDESTIEEENASESETEEDSLI